MKSIENHALILIPAFEPDERLVHYVKKLNQYDLTPILVVDDGSGENYRSIFHSLEELGCIVLTHYTNMGKGRALKTGFSYIRDNNLGCSCIVTVDCDGQHAVEDAYRMAQTAVKHPDVLVLGIRNFKEPYIPFKSLLGNRLTSFIMFLFFGRYLPDTQTGLRAFGPMFMKALLNIPGERFEYETQMLIFCIRSKIPIVEIPILTIYEHQNKGTHFHPVKDSIKIIAVITAAFIKYVSASIVSAIIDLGLAWALFDLLRPMMQETDFLRIAAATVLSRMVSIIVNYLLNKKIVFRSTYARKHTLYRYLVLCMLSMGMSVIGVYLLHTIFHFDERAAKLICDTLLFLMNYQLQMRWVFALKGVKK
jgi:putative flippase GtrA